MKQSWRVFWFGAAFVVFAVLTYIAFFHARLGSVSRPSIVSFAWWFQPIEFNAAGRINRIEPGVDFTCISALPGGREIWVGGSKGVIIHSKDDGKTWEQLPTVTAQTELAPRSYEEATPPEEQQQKEQQKKQLPPPAKSKSKAFNIQPSASTPFIAENSQENEWIPVGFPEPTRPPSAANQAAPGFELPSAPKNLRIKEAPNSANQAAPTLAPSKTERGVTEIPGIQTQGPGQSPAAPTPTPTPRSLISNDIDDLDYISSLIGFALTVKGELIATRDGGKNWRLLPSIGPDSAVTRIKFIDEERGVAVGEFGVCRTLDGGKTWSEPSSVRDRLDDIVLTNGLNGQAVGSDRVFEVTDGGSGARITGEVKIAASKDPAFTLGSIIKTDSGALFACGSNGVVIRSTSGKEWRVLSTGVSIDLYSIFFASDRFGWAVGTDGVIISTRDGGDHWKEGGWENVYLKTVYFFSEDHGFATGEGNLIETDDGGENWHPIVVAGSAATGGHGWLPAPWYFASLILLFGLVRKIPDEIPPPSRQGIAELLASDKPIGPGDPDYLGFQQTALGLSNYLRNSATEPPLTVAVTGEWGMGKSSLMNLVQGDLRSYKFRPVWFNAWHHQTEESLLAALLENVRTQAIPSIFTPEGIVFRVKLLWLRARSNLFVFLLVVAAVAFCFSYFAADPHRLTQPPQALIDLLKSPSEAIMKLAGRHEEVGKAMLVLISAIGALFTFLKGFRAFGVDPSSLLASKSNAAKAKDLRAQTSFRYRFEKQFHEVTNSLNPLTMVLFVDDLDRCRPEEVYDMLEAINFLVSCGDCFVIMGFARRRVERCVGLVFDKVAAEGPIEIDGHRISRSEQRQRFAQMYLEKLINIEVPVPKGGLDQIRTLLISKRDEPPPRSRVEIVGEKLSQLVPHLVPASLAVVAAIIAAWCSLQLFAPADSAPRTNAVASAQVQSANQPQRSSTRGEASPTPDQPPAGIGSAKFFPGQADRSPLWAILLLTAGIVTPGIIRLSRRTGSVIEDSPAFTEALDKWFPFLITGREMTPRAIKRFVNRVRYFAMMEGSFRPMRRWWERLAQFLKRKKEATPQAPSAATHEDLLVALATVHERHPEWFADELHSFIGAVMKSPNDERSSLPNVEDLLNQVTPEVYEHFKKLVAGVEVH